MAHGARQSSWLATAALACLACWPSGGAAQLVSVDMTHNTLVLTSQGFAQALADTHVTTILIECEILLLLPDCMWLRCAATHSHQASTLLQQHLLESAAASQAAQSLHRHYLRLLTLSATLAPAPAAMVKLQEGDFRPTVLVSRNLTVAASNVTANASLDFDQGLSLILVRLVCLLVRAFADAILLSSIL